MANRSQGRKKSLFPALAAIPSDATLDFVSGATNFKITLADFLAALNVTGSIVQDGDPLGTPILDVAGAINQIRNLENGSGISTSVSPENGATIEHNFVFNAVGASLTPDATALAPIFRSLVAGSGIVVSGSGNQIQISTSGVPATTKTVIINVLGDFPTPVGGVITLNGDTEYLLTNDVDVGTNRFVVGDNTVLRGADSAVITLTSSGANDLFTATDSTFRIDKITLACPSCRIFNATDATNTKTLQIIDMTVSACDKIGSLSGYNAVQINNVAFLAVATSGITLAGNTGAFFVFTTIAVMTDGSFIDLSTFTVNSATVANGLFVLVAATSFGITGTGSTNVTTIATMLNCRKSGAGSILNGIATEDDKWQFALNDEVRDTRTDALISINANATETVISAANTPVLVAGTWDDSEVASQFTIDTAGRATFTGVKDTRLPITIATTALMASGGTNSITLYAAINGSVVAESGAQNDVSTISGRSSIIWQHTFSPGDFVEHWVENNDGTVNIIVSDSVLRVN